MTRPLLALALAAALLSPGVAWAKEVAVAPMLAKPGLDPKISQAFTDTIAVELGFCLLYTSPSPRDRTRSRMPSSA